MKKNIDPKTAQLFEATKKAFNTSFSTVIRPKGVYKVCPSDIENIGHNINLRKRIAEAEKAVEETNEYCLKKRAKERLQSLKRLKFRDVSGFIVDDNIDWSAVVDIMDGYSCGLASLPRIMRELATMCGEKVFLEAAPVEDGTEAAADVVAEPVATHCVALAVVPVADAEPAPAPAASRTAADIEAELTAAVIRCYYSSMQTQAAPLPPVDAYDVETLTANAAIIRCRRRGRSVLVAVSGSEGINNFSYSAVCLETGSTIAHGCRCGADGGYNKIEAMQAGINAAIKQYFDCAEVVADADSQAEQMPEPPAVITVSAPYPPAPRHHRRRISLRPVRRWFKAAAVLVPVLIILGLLTATSGSHAAADDAAAEVVAQVVELEAVTVTAEAPDTFIEDKAPCLIEDKAPCLIEDKAPCLIEDKAPAPSPVKKLAAPSPVKNVAEAAECSSQKTDAADSPAGEKTASPMATATDAAGLTICEGTPWAYTMMNWA